MPVAPAVATPAAPLLVFAFATFARRLRRSLLLLLGWPLVLLFAFATFARRLRRSLLLWLGRTLLLLPLLVLTNGYFGPPFAYSQNITRFAAGAVLVAIILFMWWHCSAKPVASGWPLAFAGLLFLATLPWNATLAVLFTSYLHEVKATIAHRPGVIAYEDTPLPTKPWLLQGEGWSLPITSAILRSSPADGVIAPPRGYAGFLPYDASNLPSLGRFRWRD